jgi:hypothetical protein
MWRNNRLNKVTPFLCRIKCVRHDNGATLARYYSHISKGKVARYIYKEKDDKRKGKMNDDICNSPG